MKPREGTIIMMKNRRSFGRFGTELKAFYICSDDPHQLKHDCKIVNMSRKGFGLQITTDQEIEKEATISLEIHVPEKKRPTFVQGTVKWIEKKGAYWAAGVECAHILDEMEFSKRG